MKTGSRTNKGGGRRLPAVIAALVLMGMGWIAPHPAQAQVASGQVGFWTKELDLGPNDVPYAGQREGTAYLVNYSKSPVFVQILEATGPFKVYEAGESGILEPNHYASLTISFRPTVAGPATGELSARVWAPDPVLMTSALKGKGVDREKIPDLSGVWRTGEGTEYTVDYSLVRTRPGGTGKDVTLGWNAGETWFDGEVWNGQWMSRQTRSDGYFALRLVSPDRLEGVYSVGDPDDGQIYSWFLTRRSTFAGRWQTEFGVMTFQRISEAEAEALRPKFGNFWSTPPASVSWYLATYPWSGGGQILAFTANTFKTSNPPQLLVGRYLEPGGTKSGDIRADAEYSDTRGLLSFLAWYRPDNSGPSTWSGRYLGPP